MSVPAPICAQLAEQFRRRSAKPHTWVQFPHGIPAFALRASARRAIFTGIGVHRYTPVFQTGVEGAIPSCPSKFSERGCVRSISRSTPTCSTRCWVSDHRRAPKYFSRREYRCRPGLHRPGCGGSTPPSRRVHFGLQALQRCSGLLNRRARGSTVATHQLWSRVEDRRSKAGTQTPRFMLSTLDSRRSTNFPPMWLSSDSSSFVNCRAHCPTRVRVSPSAPFQFRRKKAD